VKKIILALFSLTLAMAATVVNSAPVNVTLVTDNQRSSSGTRSNLVWKTCGPPYVAPCVDPTNPWDITNNITGSTATWTWDPATGILTSTGLYWSTSHIGSNPGAFAVISDKTTDLVINTTLKQTTATSYECVEGNFLAGVGANGCGNYSLGDDFVSNSTMAYNIDLGTGPNALCEERTLNPDDVSTGGPRGVTNTDGSVVGCDVTEGAYLQYNIVFDNTATGGQLRLADDNAGVPWPVDCFDNPVAVPTCAGATWLTFAAAPTAVDDSASVSPVGSTPIAVMANDIAYTDDVTVAIATQGLKGVAVVSGSPGPQAGITIGYTPNGGASGTDQFVYTATDSDGVTSDSATVTVTILQNGANPDSATTTRNAPIDINVGANDVGFGTPVTITITTPPDQGGTATPPAPGAPAGQVISYTPATIAAGAPGYTETFTYQITDGTATGSAVVTVTVNNTPVVAGDTGVSISTAGTAPGTVTNAFNAGVAPNSLGDQPSTVTATNGAKGTTNVPSGSSTVTYTPAATFFQGTDTYTYTITDSDPGTAKTATGTVTVTILDVTPTIANGTITTTAGVGAATTLATTLGNGSSAQNVRTVSAGASGTCALAALTATGTSVNYTPNAGFTGSDSCVVTIRDENGAGPAVTGTVSVTVNSSGGGGGGGGGGGPQLPPSSGSFDLWGLSILAGASWLRRRRQLRASGLTRT
jgi:hypothetical protein